MFRWSRFARPAFRLKPGPISDVTRGGAHVTRQKPGSDTMQTMRTRSIDAKRAHPGTGLAAVAALVVTLAACGGARAAGQATQALEVAVVAMQRGSAASWQGLATADVQASAATPVAPVQQTDPITVDLVGARPDNPEAWDGFRRSVSGAATSSCFGPDALPHQEFAVEGLLRLPFLVQAAAAGACR
jgi:hypothetical protein